ncbi:MAG: helicase C-terminal domain-containing protein [Litorilinea sp.]
MSERVYIALDLETTGLNPQSDAIIEIGAVCFACRYADNQTHIRIVDRFVTFVNPNRTIPLRIQQLTGIRDADLANAPTLDDVVPELLAFIPANAVAVVAHNADFDFGFLNTAGIQFHRPTQDTFELASIFLPSMSSYSLGELCRALEISLPDAHRALDDAEATAHLFYHILHRMQSVSPAVYDILAACGKDAKWPPLLLLEQIFDGVPVATSGPDQVGDADATTNTWPVIDESNTTPDAIAAEVVEDVFDTDGALAHTLGEGYEFRQGQLDMALRVMHALNTGDHLIIEAGTGTGKSMAYLAPAALWSGRNARRVVVATHTIALQDQILDNDLPILQTILAAMDAPPIRVAVLKGRSNYLCMRRLHSWFNNRTLSRTELRVLARILIWLPTTNSGDIEDLFMPSSAEKLIWSHICSDVSTCHAGRCRPTQHAPHIVDVPIRDFFLEARRQAETAHILIVNHALLLADIAAGGKLLPAYAHVVVDEAHRLEDAATDQLSHRVVWKVVFDLLGRLEKQGDLAESIVHALANHTDSDLDASGTAAKTHIRRLGQETKQGRERLQLFAAQLLAFFQNLERLRTDLQFAQRIALDTGVRTQPMWVEIELEWDAASEALRAILTTIHELAERLESMQWWQAEPYATYLTDLQSLQAYFNDMVAWVDRIIFEPPGLSDATSVAWVEVNDAHNDATLVAAPLHVHELIEQQLIHTRRSVIFTGATLRTGSGFTFIRDRLGLWDVTASTVESPFDYQANALLYLPADMPEPNQGAFQQAVEQAIMRAAVATGGSTLALFTSYAQLRATADAIRAPLDRQGITVLQHGVSSRRRILREYRNTERAVLLGTRSFWEGIDLPGDELRCLLIVRLPFAVPTDPLVAARSKEFENPFRDYTLPDAIIRFRQGFGRLIRRATDRGVVVILDSRIWRKEYGQAFLESLPACTVRHAPLANLDTEIRQWLQR